MNAKKDEEINPLNLLPGQEVDLMELDPTLKSLRFQVDWTVPDGVDGYEIDLSLDED